MESGRQNSIAKNERRKGSRRDGENENRRKIKEGNAESKKKRRTK